MQHPCALRTLTQKGPAAHAHPHVALVVQVLPKKPDAVADFLRTTKGLSKRRIGDYLGETSEFVTQVCTGCMHARILYHN